MGRLGASESVGESIVVNYLLLLKYVYFSLRGSMYSYTKLRGILVNPPEETVKTRTRSRWRKPAVGTASRREARHQGGRILNLII